MECQNCKKNMKLIEKFIDDDCAVTIHKCSNCKWQAETWINLEEDVPNHTEWIDENRELV